ncbi:MAG: HPr family phosphocarrier protein [Lachnospiraceae bacterium]|nr:HPr family phosphocarrier protein [Lachnospiraceae bacterium]
MTSRKVIVSNPTGLHARPASQLTQFCKQFPEKIILKGNGKETDPKSIIMLLSAGLKKGTEIEVVVEGDNEVSVCAQVAKFIETLSE